MNKTQLATSIVQAIGWLKERSTSNTEWMLGGSCSLLIQGVSLSNPPQDIDIYADSESATALHHVWKEAAVDLPEWNETPIYRSLLSHYTCCDCAVELVGQFRIQTSWCSYETVIQDVLWSQRIEVQLDNRTISIMPLSHELIFNLLRDRLDRVEAIAAVIRRQPEAHKDAMHLLLRQCNPTHAMAVKVCEWIPEWDSELLYQ